jgi:hypothetical protein
MSNATAAAGTMKARAGIVTLELTTGDTYTTKDGGNFVARLDRLMGADGWRRGGYRYEGGAMVANLTRTKLLADHVATR